MFKRKLKELSISENTGTIPNNPSEETILGNNKIKEEHETMTLQDEDVMLKNT